VTTLPKWNNSFRKINLTEIVEHAVQTARDFSDPKIEFQTDQTESTVLANDRYATTVLVKLVSDRSSTTVYIEDDGPGIPPDARQHVLKPFIRNASEQGKHGTRDGYGLGLAIVNRIAEWHQAKLQIDDSSKLGGASIKLAFNHQHDN